MSKESLLRNYRYRQVENRAEWLKNLAAAVMTTTVCNKHCPLCSHRDVVNSANAQHFPADEVIEDVRGLHNVNNVCLTGGEPTLHPDIERILALSREVRGTAQLDIITNGVNLLKIAAATKYADVVRLSIFWNTVEESNRIADEYQKVKPANVTLCRTPVTHGHTGSGQFPCHLLLDTIGVMRGRVYTCCGGSGVVGAQSTELSVGWEKRLLSVEAPCEGCFAGL